MASRPALLLLSLAATAALAGFTAGAPFGRWLAAFAVVTFPIALIVLGASRNGRLGALRGPLLVVWLVLAGGFALLLALPEGGPEVPGLGLPLGTAVMLFVLVPVPFAILCWAYAARFDRLELRDEDLERVRSLAPRRASQSAPDDGNGEG